MTMMLCPLCDDSQLNLHRLEDGPAASRCPKCGGEFIERSDYDRWVGRAARAPAHMVSQPTARPADTKQAKLCSQCRRIMLRFRVGAQPSFAIDGCTTCGGVWLDAGEWESLRARSLHAQLRRIRSDTWRKELRGEERRAAIESMLERALGPDLPRVKELREWLRAHPNRRRILAFLLETDPYE